MSNSSSTSTSSGIGVSGLLGVVFVVLKLIGEQFHTPVADWSWLWVLSPFWIPIAILLAVALVAFLVWLGLAAAAAYSKSKRQRAIRENAKRRGLDRNLVAG